MKKLFQMFLDGSGDTSSKRIAGVALIASGIVGAFVGMDSASVGILIGAGTGIFTVQAITKT
jgi:hypothetical protein